MRSLSETQHKKMTESPIPRLIMGLAVPNIITQLITVIYNATDTYFVSHISTEASGAVGIVFSLMSIIHSLGFGIGMGTSGIVSKKLGEKKNDEANKYASSAFFLAIVVGCIITLLGFINTKGLMRMLGSTETILPHAVSYASIILIGAPIMCSSFVLNNVLKSEGAATLSMAGLCVGSIFNIILDPVFIFKMNMGIAGAALATVLSQTASFIILLSFFVFKKSIVHLSVKNLSKKVYDYYYVFKIGFPTICRQGLASVSSVLLNFHAGYYGDTAVSAISIANKVYIFVRHFVIGVGQGFQPFAGYNYGAKINKRVKEGFKFACMAGSVICVAAAVILYMFPREIMGWFSESEEVVRIGSKALVYTAYVMPFMAYSTYVNQLYQCLGFSKQATFLASLRQGICFVPLMLILPHFIGITAVQSVQPLSDFLTFLISVPFQIAFFRNHLK